MTEENVLGFVRSINQQNSGATYNDLLAEMIWNGASEADVIEEVFTRNQHKYNKLAAESQIEEEVLKEAKQQIYEGVFVFKEIKDTLDIPVMPDTDDFDDDKRCAYALIRYCTRLPAALEKELILRSAAVRNIHAIKENTAKVLNDVPKFKLFNIETHAQQALKIASSQIIEALVWEITLSNNNPANPNRDPDFSPAKLKEKAESNNLACMFAEAYEVSSDREFFIQRYNEAMNDLKALYAQNTITMLDKAEAVLDKINEKLDKTAGKTVDAVINNTSHIAAELNNKIPEVVITVADNGIQAFKAIYETVVPKNFIDSIDKMTSKLADKILEAKDDFNDISSSAADKIKNSRLKDVLKSCSIKIEQARTAFQNNKISLDVKAAIQNGNSLNSLQSIKDKLINTKFAEQKGPFKDFIKAVKDGTEKINRAVCSCLEMMEIQKEEQRPEKNTHQRLHYRSDRA